MARCNLAKRARRVAGRQPAHRQPARLHRIALGIPLLALGVGRERRLITALQKQRMAEIVIAKGQIRRELNHAAKRGL